VGVLDDAIKEHLELKLRRGADPSEVSQQEAEALGPARREPAGEPTDEEALVEQVPAGDVPDAEPPTQLAEELVPPAEPSEPEPAPEPDAPPDEAEPESPGLHAVEEDLDEPDEVPADEQISPPTEPMRLPHPDAPPPAVPEEKRGDDPLWFEQAPKRDFDFDE
jgi:hypothetical protein